MSVLSFVRGRIEAAITQELAKAQIANEEAEALAVTAGEVRRRIMSDPGYRPHDERGEKTWEARKISESYEARNARLKEAHQHTLEAEAYQRLMVRIFGDCEIEEATK